MQNPRRKRLTVVAIAAFAAFVGISWFGDLSSAIPLDVHEDGGDEPLLQPPAVAAALVRRALVPYGGLPHDAQLTASVTNMATAMVADGTTAQPMVVGFNQTYEPNDAPAWKDHIVARVGAVTQQTCADGGSLPLRYRLRTGPAPTCRRYVLTFPLHVTGLQREWRPWLVRGITRWAVRTFGPAVSAPASVTTSCPRPPDVAALRRVVAGIDGVDYPMSFIFDRKHMERSWTMALEQPGATVARWTPPYPVVRVHDAVEIVAAVVGDAPNRIITVRFSTPLPRTGGSVLMFHTTDDEPVCGPLERAREPRLTRPGTAWDSIVAIVRARAESEVRWRTSGHRAPGSSRVVSVDRRPGTVSSVVVETSQPYDGRWRARFTLDERVPEIRDAEFTRIDG